jgi:hypothetical protein
MNKVLQFPEKESSSARTMQASYAVAPLWREFGVSIADCFWKGSPGDFFSRYPGMHARVVAALIPFYKNGLDAEGITRVMYISRDLYLEQELKERGVIRQVSKPENGGSE